MSSKWRVVGRITTRIRTWDEWIGMSFEDRRRCRPCTLLGHRHPPGPGPRCSLHPIPLQVAEPVLPLWSQVCPKLRATHGSAPVVVIFFFPFHHPQGEFFLPLHHTHHLHFADGLINVLVIILYHFPNKFMLFIPWHISHFLSYIISMTNSLAAFPLFKIRKYGW